MTRNVKCSLAILGKKYIHDVNSDTISLKFYLVSTDPNKISLPTIYLDDTTTLANACKLIDNIAQISYKFVILKLIQANDDGSTLELIHGTEIPIDTVLKNGHAWVHIEPTNYDITVLMRAICSSE